VVFWLVRALLALVPGLALAWPIKKIAAFLAMIDLLDRPGQRQARDEGEQRPHEPEHHPGRQHHVQLDDARNALTRRIAESNGDKGGVTQAGAVAAALVTGAAPARARTPPRPPAPCAIRKSRRRDRSRPPSGSGWDLAAERSLVMTLVMLGAVLVDRPALSLRNLALARQARDEGEQRPHEPEHHPGRQHHVQSGNRDDVIDPGDDRGHRLLRLLGLGPRGRALARHDPGDARRGPGRTTPAASTMCNPEIETT
jgi:hypothetical protein